MASHKLIRLKSFSVFPKIQLGWWGLGLTLSFLLMLALRIFNPGIPLPFPSFVIFGAGIIGLALNLWAFILGDRSWVLLFMGGAIDVFMVTWLIAEVAFPH